MSLKHFVSLFEIERSGLHISMGYPTLYNFLREFLGYEDYEALELLKQFAAIKIKLKAK